MFSLGTRKIGVVRRQSLYFTRIEASVIGATLVEVSIIDRSYLDFLANIIAYSRTIGYHAARIFTAIRCLIFPYNENNIVAI